MIFFVTKRLASNFCVIYLFQIKKGGNVAPNVVLMKNGLVSVIEPKFNFIKI